MSSVQSIYINKTEMYIQVNTYAILFVHTLPVDAENDEIGWEIKDTSVVSLNNNIGQLRALRVGDTDVTVYVKSNPSIRATCKVHVRGRIPVESISFPVPELTMNVNNTMKLGVIVSPSNATNRKVYWNSCCPDIATVDSDGTVRPQAPGKVEIYATTEDRNLTAKCTIYVMQTYAYELVHTFGFKNNLALQIESLYDKIKSVYDEEEIELSWRYSRLLGGIYYCKNDSSMTSKLKWNDVAGDYNFKTEEDYFVNVLGYTTKEYSDLVQAINNQHSTNKPDFAHMQISLAARLAYELNYDGFLANIYTFGSDETISYLAGWLGDATIPNDGKTSIGDDDYCADLDAENVYRLLISSSDTSIIDTLNSYYDSFKDGTRAEQFLNNISYSTVENMIYKEFDIDKSDDPMRFIEENHPDTYNFLCSLCDKLHHIRNYQI